MEFDVGGVEVQRRVLERSPAIDVQHRQPISMVVQHEVQHVAVDEVLALDAHEKAGGPIQVIERQRGELRADALFLWVFWAFRVFRVFCAHDTEGPSVVTRYLTSTEVESFTRSNFFTFIRTTCDPSNTSSRRRSSASLVIAESRVTLWLR